MKRLFTAVLMCFVLGAGVVSSATAAGKPKGKTVEPASGQDFADVAAKLHAAYPQIQYERIEKSPIEGVYFVKGGGNIIHFLPPDTLVFGDMIKSGVNITAQARTAYEAEQDSAIASTLADLPLDAAIKIGNGPKTVIEVSDPDCPYCRRGTEWFGQNKDAEAKDVTRYVFLYPLPFHKNSPAKAKYILCAADKALAYEEVFAGKHDNIVEGSPVPEGCDDKAVTAALNRDIDIANKLRVRGTPNYFIGNKRVAGLDIAGITAGLKALQPDDSKAKQKKGGK